MHQLPPLPDLPRELRLLLAQIPRGRVTSYGTLATALGDRLASRWVGHYLLHHPHGSRCACHRVVRSDGALGDYIDGGPPAKARLLAREGVKLSASGRVDRQRDGFDDFLTTQPLAALQQAQRQAATHLQLQPPRSLPCTVAALDVSYTSTGHATAAYVLVDFNTSEVLWSTTVQVQAPFPYIPSYLTFRELPALLQVYEAAERHQRLADLYLVDGSGVIHPHQIGVASHFGVAIDRPTIGVAKRLLCGSVDTAGLTAGEWRVVTDAGQVRGAAVRASVRSKQILYVSPGNHVDVDYATRVVCRLLGGRRLPEPLYWADRLSRQVARNEPLVDLHPHAASPHKPPRQRRSSAR